MKGKLSKKCFKTHAQSHKVKENAKKMNPKHSQVGITLGIHFGSWKFNKSQIFGLKVKITNLVQIEPFLNC
jgi:hypothetical protein